MANLIKAGDYKMDQSWDLVSVNAKDLVQKMLIVNPLKRITINEIQKHPWLAEVNIINYFCILLKKT